MTPRKETLGAAICLAVPAYAGVFLSNFPATVSPFPLLTTIPAVLLSASLANWGVGEAISKALICFTPVITFLIWNPSLMRGEGKLPRRTFVALMVCTVLTIPYFLLDLADSYPNQLSQPAIFGLLNAIFISVLWLGMLKVRRAPSFYLNLAVHWLLFAWLLWCAFPYFGELP